MALFSYFDKDMYFDLKSARTLSERPTQIGLKNKRDLLVSEGEQASGPD